MICPGDRRAAVRAPRGGAVQSLGGFSAVPSIQLGEVLSPEGWSHEPRDAKTRTANAARCRDKQEEHDRCLPFFNAYRTDPSPRSTSGPTPHDRSIEPIKALYGQIPLKMTPGSVDYVRYKKRLSSPNKRGGDGMVRDGVANIVHQLQKRGFDLRRVGADSWESRCPAHGRADHALSITRNELNQVLLECRSTQNCRYEQIIRAVLLGYDTLYNETPDWWIRELSGIPIQPASSESSQGHEERNGGSSAVEAANGSARAALPAQRHADPGAIKTESIPEPARAPLEPRVQAAAEATIPPETTISPEGSDFLG